MKRHLLFIFLFIVGCFLFFVFGGRFRKPVEIVNDNERGKKIELKAQEIEVKKITGNQKIGQ
jgi:hypothetical protein